MSRSAARAGPACLGPDDRDLMLLVEGRPLPSVAQAARALGLPCEALRRRLARLHDSGAVREVTVFDPAAAGWRHETIARLRVDWTRPAEIAQLEDDLRDAACVLRADLVSGPFDFIVHAAHAGLREAAEWVDALKVRPCIVSIRADQMRTRMRNDVRVGHIANSAPAGFDPEAPEHGEGELTPGTAAAARLRQGSPLPPPRAMQAPQRTNPGIG